MCIYFTDIEDLEKRISRTLKALDQVFETEHLLNFPNYVMLKKEVEEHCIQLHRSIHTGLLVIGPKGCGKTTSLYKLSLDLQMKTLYVDLATVKNLQKELHVFIRERDDIDVLLIDNVQCFDSSVISFLTVPFIVAASSPGRDSENVHEFQKTHIDGMVGTVHFSPLDKKWSKTYLEHLGVAVKNETEQMSTDPVGGAELMPTDPPVGGAELMPTDPPVGGAEQMPTDPPVGGAEQMPTDPPVGGAELMPTDPPVGGPEQMPTDPPTRVTSVTWQEFLQLVYLTGGIPRYLHTYVTNKKRYLTRMSNEMLKQLDDAVKEYSLTTVVENVTRIVLRQDASDLNCLVKINVE